MRLGLAFRALQKWNYPGKVYLPYQEPSGLIDRLTYSFKKWGYYKNYWCQLGLLHDDTYMELDNTGNDIIVQAIERLPEDMKNERIFRIRRATELTMKRRILPEEEWTKPHEDVMYLQPYIDQVTAEINENKEFLKLNA